MEDKEHPSKKLKKAEPKEEVPAQVETEEEAVDPKDFSKKEIEEVKIALEGLLSIKSADPNGGKGFAVIVTEEGKMFNGTGITRNMPKIEMLRIFLDAMHIDHVEALLMIAALRKEEGK